MAGRAGESVSLDSAVKLQSDSGQFDPATYVAASVFNAVAFPPGMPDFLKDHIEREANFAQMLDIAGLTIGGPGGGPLDPESKAEREERETEESLAYFRDVAEEIEQRREEEHEREWLRSEHSYAGETRSGTEWKAMSDWFRDDRNAEAWEDQMMAETGQTREDVRRTGGKMKRFYDLMDKDAKGTLSNEERSEFGTLQQDTELGRGLQVQEEVQGLRAAPANNVTTRNEAVTSGDQDTRIAARASLMNDDDGSSLSAVKPITQIYQAFLIGLFFLVRSAIFVLLSS